MGKYDQAFKHNMSTSELRKALCVNAQTVAPEDKDELFDAYSKAFKIALNREIASSLRGYLLD